MPERFHPLENEPTPKPKPIPDPPSVLDGIVSGRETASELPSEFTNGQKVTVGGVEWTVESVHPEGDHGPAGSRVTLPRSLSGGPLTHGLTNAPYILISDGGPILRKIRCTEEFRNRPKGTLPTSLAIEGTE